ncbi:MAG: DPP IV N-terminal domain-containing protein, partial [Chloroflexota bacterium]
LYASTRAGNRQLWVMNANGSDPRQITNVSDIGGRNSWSPDGRTIVFYAGKREDKSRNIYVVDADSSNLQQLTFEGDSLGPCFSPYGGWIVFTSFRDGDNDIYLMSLDGLNIINLTQNAGSDYQPRWGP